MIKKVEALSITQILREYPELGKRTKLWKIRNDPELKFPKPRIFYEDSRPVYLRSEIEAWIEDKYNNPVANDY